jgi:hypothetical protein
VDAPTGGEESRTRSLVSLLTHEGPRGNYSGLGALQNVFVRNLSQLERASPEAHTAAVRAAASSGQVAVLLRGAVPKIERALSPKGPAWDEVRGMAHEQLRSSFEQQLSGLLGHMEGTRGFPQDLVATAAALLEANGFDTYGRFIRQTFRDAAGAEAVPATADGRPERHERPGLRDLQHEDRRARLRADHCGWQRRTADPALNAAVF